MAREVYQYVFRQDTPAQDWADAVSGAAFADKFTNGVEVLGIQALPGTRFKLNEYPSWVIVGPTGVFELDLTNKTFITSLSFDAESIRSLMNVSTQVPLLIDIIYQGD